jgi:signal transduction histidine kinase
VSELTARFDLPLGNHAPAAARRVVTGVLEGWGYADRMWLDRAEVVVSELVSTAVKHSGGAIGVAVELHDEAVTVSVVDGDTVVPETGATDLLDALAAAWGVHDHEGGKRVWAELPVADRRALPSGSERKSST